MIDFIHHKKIFLIISAGWLLASLWGLIVWGWQLSIDFTGGSLLEFSSPQLSSGEIQTTAANYFQVESLQQTAQHNYLLRSEIIDQAQKDDFLKSLRELHPDSVEIQELRFETVGPTLGRELVIKTLNAVVLVALIIVAYVAWQFQQLKFGVCAILAMFHDSLILLGVFSWLGHFWQVEVDVLFVTALLTTLSLSIHDTLVIYDRIRELSRQHLKLRFPVIANLAILETLTRSFNNSLTIILMLLALVILGGSTIHWFGVALLVGTIAGTYSSTFVAVPLLVGWDELAARGWQLKKK